MKIAIKKYFTLLSLVLLACSDNLEEVPLYFFEEGNSFKTENDATAALNGVYSRLRDDSYYGMGWIVLSDVNADNGSVQTNGSANAVELDQNTFSATNAYFDGFYTAVYAMIDRANRVIKHVPAIEMNETLKAQIVGEAKFLRALGYFDLVRAFGDVPLLTAPSNDAVNVAVSRTDQARVYEQIVADLRDAETVLPVAYTAAGQIGRATVGAAKSLLAKVYLTTGDWTNAAAKAKEVIDADTYSLFPDFNAVFQPENKNGQEHIFSIQYSCAQLQYASSFSKNFAIYFSYPFGGGGNFQSNDYYANSFLPGDHRKEITIIMEKQLEDGTIIESRTGPHTDKYWDPAPCGDNRNRNNFMVIRYADVLLMYAEAENELNGPTQSAYDAINAVRKRARNNDDSANPQDLSGLSKETFRDAVLQERSWELSFEGHRRWDLLRTGRYISTMTDAGITATEKHLLYPIPQNEIDVNPALK